MPHHHAELGGAWTKHAAGGHNHFQYFYMRVSVRHALERQACDNDFAHKSLELQNDVITVGGGMALW